MSDHTLLSTDHVKYTLLTVDKLKPFPHRATYMVKPDRRQLALSIRQHGILMPITVNSETLEVIDGTERMKVAIDLNISHVPVVFVEGDSVDMMLLHVTMNRYQSNVVNARLSKIVRAVLRSGKYEEDELRSKLGLTLDEFLVLQDGTVIRQRNIPEHEFSKAWVPVESNSADDFRIERPTGKSETD